MLNILRETRKEFFKEYDLGSKGREQFVESLNYLTPRVLDNSIRKISDALHKRVICYAPRDADRPETFENFYDGWRYFGPTHEYLCYKEKARCIDTTTRACRADAAWLSDVLWEYLQANPDHMVIYDYLSSSPKLNPRVFHNCSLKSFDTEDHYFVYRHPIELADIYGACTDGWYDFFFGIMTRVPPQANWCDKRELSEEDYRYIFDNMQGCFSLIWDQTSYAVCWLDESWRDRTKDNTRLQVPVENGHERS
jgi:hypothetical protein